MVCACECAQRYLGPFVSSVLLQQNTQRVGLWADIFVQQVGAGDAELHLRNALCHLEGDGRTQSEQDKDVSVKSDRGRFHICWSEPVISSGSLWHVRTGSSGKKNLFPSSTTMGRTNVSMATKTSDETQLLLQQQEQEKTTTSIMVPSLCRQDTRENYRLLLQSQHTMTTWVRHS